MVVGLRVAISEEGSIGGATCRLRLTQPALSRQLRGLERGLGAGLFARSGRGLDPTIAGDALLRRAVRMLADAEATLEDLRLAAEGKTSRLTAAFTGRCISGALGKRPRPAAADLPDVDLSLMELFGDAEVSTGTLDGSLDVAVQRLPVRFEVA
ncbi:LysR family transcriptional regulator [Actinomadura nitritigenes]|uniref:LysR family transcriptional regulator n=1 Tax=Actinomadura nitritigenes TaxID=134602 RepID=UPI003D8B9210